jgi:hypothetical protein
MYKPEDKNSVEIETLADDELDATSLDAVAGGDNTGTGTCLSNTGTGTCTTGPTLSTD